MNCPHNPVAIDYNRSSPREVEVDYWCEQCGNFTVAEATGPDDLRKAEASTGLVTPRVRGLPVTANGRGNCLGADDALDIDNDPYDGDDSDPRCTHCNGEIWVECDDPIQCCDPRCDGEMHPDPACGGTGLFAHQVIF